MMSPSVEEAKRKRRQLPPLSSPDHDPCSPAKPMKPVIRLLLLIGGTAALTMGVIGIFVPVLPTTPFLLLAAAAYLRSSRRLYSWLTGHRLLGSMIRDYLFCKAVSRKARNGALVFLWLSLVVSFILVPVWFVRVILVLVGTGVSIHLMHLKIRPSGPGGQTTRTARQPDQVQVIHSNDHEPANSHTQTGQVKASQCTDIQSS